MLRCNIINTFSDNSLNFRTVDAALSAHYATLFDRHGSFVANAKDTAAPLISCRPLRQMFDLIH